MATQFSPTLVQRGEGLASQEDRRNKMGVYQPENRKHAQTFNSHFPQKKKKEKSQPNLPFPKTRTSNEINSQKL